MSIVDFLQQHIERTLKAYEAQPERIIEDARAEEQWLSGGYGHRQIYELIQNGADAIQEAKRLGRIEVLLTNGILYCANEGAPVTEGGIRALLMAHLSEKCGDEIGRFGLGFKSVLGVCDNPEVFSRSVSFRFNPPDLTERLQSLVGTSAALPRLRTACLLDWDHETAADPALNALAEWAETVVRLPLIAGVHDRLAQDLESFPAEFLVFSPHVTQLILRATDGVVDRQFRVRSTDGQVTIADGDADTRWHVFRASISTTELPSEARLDMDVRLRERERLPLVWAVSVDSSRRQRGRFWSFFPTQTETTLQGILNAPWKTNSDRENLLDGPFNQEMLKRAADLVVNNIAALNTPEDPARFLDALPARDDLGWADRALSETVIEQLKSRKCMPTARGGYELPGTLALRPDVSREERIDPLVKEFERFEPCSLVHRLAEAGDRSGRTRRLGSAMLDTKEWLESLSPGSSVENSLAAIRLADALLGTRKVSEWEIGEASFVHTTHRVAVAPNKDRLAFADGCETPPDTQISFVHPSIAADPNARRILIERFRIAPICKEAIFRAFLAREGPMFGGLFGAFGFQGQEALNRFWGKFWILSRQLSVDATCRLLAETAFVGHYCARTAAGEWKFLHQVLLPGRIIEEPIPEDCRAVVIDRAYHQSDLPLLIRLGALDQPEPGATRGAVYEMYRNRDAIPQFRAACRGSNPQSQCLVFIQGKAWEPLDPITSLRGDAAVRFSSCLLVGATSEPRWKMAHTNPGYPIVEMTGLLPWALRNFGWLNTSLGPMPVSQTVGPSLGRFRCFFPIVTCTDAEARLLSRPNDPCDIGEEQWAAAFRRAMVYIGELPQLTGFYAASAISGRARPQTLRCQVGENWSECGCADVQLTADPGVLQILKADGVPALYSPIHDDIEALVEKWQLHVAEQCALEFEAAEDAVQAVDRFPELRAYEQLRDRVVLQPCEHLWLEKRSAAAGRVRHEIQYTFRNDTLYFPADRDVRWLLERLSDHFALGLTSDTVALIAGNYNLQAHRARLERVRQCSSLEEKLVEAIGAANLRAGIPHRHLTWLLRCTPSPSPVELARLAHSVYGIEVLKAYHDAIAFRGFDPPSHWAGGSRAVGFVRDLGFPEEYAGFPGQGREPWEDVMGPVTLPPLHDFQERMCAEVITFLRLQSPDRGMLSLPTGAGKTRVAVEALVRWIKGSDRPASVLWIAQSDELCEQSLQSWLQAWRAIGKEQEQLRVIRLWGATNERARAPEVGSVLIVATFQSLGNRLSRQDLEWMFSPDAVVIDEAHGSIAPSYTEILSRLGIDQRRTTRSLIGLTATPFRGTDDEDETRRLAFRYGHRRFDTGIAEALDLHRMLQEMGVLAHADHDLLQGDEIVLSPGELATLKQYGILPPSVETRLGENVDRNERILADVRKRPADWPIIIFAASVSHAEELAVRLDMNGISASAITGDTSTGRRRHSIDSFKRGKIRVLTNYGVLTTGFDAPAVRAVYVTRPVYSRVLYQQMIGRGLRGPKNGGKARCLIVNVQDNIQQYGGQLAFHHFEYLWKARK